MTSSLGITREKRQCFVRWSSAQRKGRKEKATYSDKMIRLWVTSVSRDIQTKGSEATAKNHTWNKKNGMENGDNPDV